MKLTEAYQLMEKGKKIRRPSWEAGRYMQLREDGIEETKGVNGEVLALGYREFQPCDDYEDFEYLTVPNPEDN